MVASNILERCKSTIESHYGTRLKGIVVYGSVARDETEVGSDIDLLILLKTPFNYFDELRSIIELLYPIQLESDRLISAKPALLAEYESGSIQLYRNARRDGILL